MTLLEERQQGETRYAEARVVEWALILGSEMLPIGSTRRSFLRAVRACLTLADVHRSQREIAHVAALSQEKAGTVVHGYGGRKGKK